MPETKRAQPLQRWRTHHRIANPVGATDQNSPDPSEPLT
jgi:hypothetical protein